MDSSNLEDSLRQFNLHKAGVQTRLSTIVGTQSLNLSFALQDLIPIFKIGLDDALMNNPKRELGVRVNTADMAAVTHAIIASKEFYDLGYDVGTYVSARATDEITAFKMIEHVVGEILALTLGEESAEHYRRRNTETIFGGAH